MICKSIFLIIIGLNPGLWKFLNSTFFQSLIILGAPALAAYIAIISFYSQQRTNRLQKAYFEDTLVAQLKNLESALSTKDHNTVILENSMNFIRYSLNRYELNKEYILKFLDKTISSFKVSKFTLYSTKETLTEMLGVGARAYHLAQWIDMFELDMTRICQEFKGQLIKLKDLIVNLDARTQVKRIITYTQLINGLNRRHLILIYFTTKLIELFGEANFKNKKEVFNFYKTSAVSNLLETADETFKLLFGFYKINDSLYYSYAKNKFGEHIKLWQLPNQDWKLELEKPEFELSEGQFFIIKNQDLLAMLGEVATNSGQKIQVAMFLYEIAELHVFGKKRDFLPSLLNFEAQN